MPIVIVTCLQSQYFVSCTILGMAIPMHLREPQVVENSAQQWFWMGGIQCLTKVMQVTSHANFKTLGLTANYKQHNYMP